MPGGLRKVETAWQGHLTVLIATLRGRRGETVRREIVHHGRSACVLPYDPVRRVALLVNQARAPVIWAGGTTRLLEAPAGKVEDEDAEDTAVREALEECGVRLARLVSIGAPFASPGASSERVDLFLAEYGAGDRVAPGGGVASEHEDIDVQEVPLPLLWQWVEQRRIEDLKTMALILSLRVQRPELFSTAGSRA